MWLFAGLKHNVYYFIVSLLVLVLLGHVTRSGARDWLAAPLSLFCCYLMATFVSIVDLCGSVWSGCGWLRS